METIYPNHPPLEPRHDAWRWWLWRAILVAWLAGLGAVYAHIPPSPDQAELEYVAWRVLEGDVLYRDVVDMNWPVGVWLHQLSAWANPDRWHPWRVVDFGFIVLGTLAGAAIARKWWGKAPARWVWWVYPLLSITAGGWWFAGQRDAMIGHLAIVAAWAHLSALTSRGRKGVENRESHNEPPAQAGDHQYKPKRKRGLSCIEPITQRADQATACKAVPPGSFACTMGSSFSRRAAFLLIWSVVAVAVLLKPTAIVLALALVLHALLCAAKGTRVRTAMVEALFAGIAGAATLGVALVVMLVQGVQLDEFWQSAFTYNTVTQHWESAGVGALLGGAMDQFGGAWHWIALAGVLSAAWMLTDRRRTRSVRTILPVLCLAGLVSFVWQGKGYAYHLGGAYQPMVLIALIGIGAVSTRFGGAQPALEAGGLGPRRSARGCPVIGWFARAAVVVVLCGIGFKLAQLRHAAQYALGLEGRSSYHALFDDGEGVTLADLDRVVEMIRGDIGSDDRVLLWGIMHAVNLRLRAAQPTRFYYSPMLLQAREPLPMGKDWVEQYAADLRAHQPVWCVINRAALERCRDDNPPVAQIVDELLDDYELFESFGGADVYHNSR